MKSIIKLLAAFTLVLAMFSQPRGASAADVFHFTGQAVDGTFINIDPSGCIYTSVDLMAAEQIAQPPPDAVQPSGWIFVHVFQADFCTSTVFHTANVTVPLSELKFTGNLNLATLRTTVSLVDYLSNEPFDVAIDLTWTATNPRRHENTPSHYNFGGCHLNYHYNTAYRIAAVSGNVSVGTTNFRPELSELWGTIFSTKYGEVFHGCN